MSKVLRVSLMLVLLVAPATTALACGDKLLVLGRGVRYRLLAGRSASILAFVPAGDASAAWVTHPRLRQEFADAGYKLVIVENDEQFAQALRAQKFDVVLADPAHEAEIDRRFDTAASGAPIFVPLVTSAPERTLARQYCCVLRSGSKPGRALDVVDKALNAKTKRDRTKAHGD